MLQGKTVQGIYEINKGKLLCGIYSDNEFWIVDYINMTEKKLCDTFGPVLSFIPFSDIRQSAPSLFLTREKEWVCILNIRTAVLTRILRIPHYVNEATPTMQYICFTSYDPHKIEFAAIWGSTGNKIAKFSINPKLVDFLENHNPN